VRAGQIKILPVATETARAPFSLGDYAKLAPLRLIGLTWGAEDLSSAIGAATNKDETGAWDEPYRMVRSLCLLAAHAANVQAIDTLYGDYRDEAGLRRSCAIARRQGFTGRIAIHPDQVQAINESFSPSPDEVAHARRVIAAFEAQPGAGTVGLDGLMLDIPHLRLAQRILATHEAHQNG
jgi:citrate lyase subunit beta/citryl-CoA lyase